MKHTPKTIIKRSGVMVASAVLVVASLSSLIFTPTHALSIVAPSNCDDNAVIYCGADSTQALLSKYDSGDGHNSVKSVHDIYSYFGIESGDVQAMNPAAVSGSVNSNGNVYIDGTAGPVASGAITAGRQDIAGSTTVTSNGTTFYSRPPSVSFRSASLAAYVVMKDGVFQFAIIASCANPVRATPTPKPAPPAPQPVTTTTTPTTPGYTISKQVAVKGTTTFTQDVAVSPGTHVIYQIIVKSTGTAPLTNLTTSDALPTSVSYVGGSFSQDGTAQGDDMANRFFGSGLSTSTLNPGDTTTFQFEAVVGSTADATQCTAQPINNVAHTTVTSGLQPGSATATVNEQCVSTAVVPTPVITTPPPVITTTPVAVVQPTQLVDTGPGSLLGLFAGIVTVGTLLHRSVTLRKIRGSHHLGE